MRTLRARLLIGTALGTGLVLSASALVLYFVVRAALWAEFDEALGSKARSLAAPVEQEGDALELDFEKTSLPEFMSSPRAEYYQLWTAAGLVIARSDSLNGRDLELINGVTNSPTYRSVRLPDGRPGRLVEMTFVPRQEIEDEEDDDDDNGRGHHDESRHIGFGERLVITLAVGRGTAPIDRALDRLRLLLVCGCAGAMFASLAVLSWSVRRGLQPLGHVAAQIAAIHEATLSSRLEPGDAPGEVVPIITRLNDLLARLDTAFAREKAFTADAAHELRTPLAGLRSTLEVSLSKERAARDYQDAMAKSLAICLQMQQMVENLLEMTRAEAGQLEVASEAVDLVALLKDSWAQFAGQATDRRLEVAWQLPESCYLTTDRTKVGLVFNNIFDNAVTYADAGGQVTISLYCEHNRIDMRVANTGSRITETDADHVFDRFWRGDAARTSDANGRRYGLGLPLCQRLITLLGGSISASCTSYGSFAIAVVFPKR